MLGPIIRLMKRRGLVPEISPTERAALDAGTVWIEGQLFSGAPDFRAILREPYPLALAPDEQAFIDGPVTELCRMVDPWEISRTRRIPADAWNLLAREGFFGMRIGKAHGGRGFSAMATSQVIGMVTTRSLALGVLVLVPNSLGPGELLEHYGTKEQQAYYLPRLATGVEIPCFALTEPDAGSDAAAITSAGVVFKDPSGELHIRLNWDKRFITLAPVATLIGLAFVLHDPDELLGQGPEPGITCALVPARADGVDIGRRHDPLGIAFPNGPIKGHDVVIPVSAIIGGPAYAGRGWTMLMDCLSAGRGISLPGQSAAGAKMVARLTGAYSVVRRQFGLSIGKFEGIEEPLARLAGLSYLMEAARTFTCGAIDSGQKPSVVSAMVKYQQTELGRALVADAMDVVAGSGICRGPKNLLAEGYTGAPIGITVEGANILTRTLIVFGQGAVRCHPYARRELEAIHESNSAALAKAVVAHIWWATKNFLRLVGLELSRGWLAWPMASGPAARHVRRLAWASARFAVLADLAMFGLGGALKRMGRTTGRFADALSWMYLATCAVRRFEAEGRLAADRPLLDWSCQHALAEVQAAFEALLANIRFPLIGWLLRGPVCAWVHLNRIASPPHDPLVARAADTLRAPGPDRDRRSRGVFLPTDTTAGPGLLDHAFALAVESTPAASALRRLAREGKIEKGALDAMAREALHAGLMSEADCKLVVTAEEARRAATAVDSFSPDEYFFTGEENGARTADAPVAAGA